MNDAATAQHETAPLELGADEIRRLGYRIVDIIADELADPGPARRLSAAPHGRGDGDAVRRAAA
jgi:hypothetical protein